MSNYDTIMARAIVDTGNIIASRILVRMRGAGNLHMPPPPYTRLDSQKINKIAKWIEQGARNNACSACDTVSTFSGAIKPLFALKCQGCHNDNSPPAHLGVKLQSHAEIVFEINKGRLIHSVKQEPGYLPMPKYQPKLTECELKQIQKWMDAGMPNN
jgi:mono/diheme cytochrome c family protein